MSRVVFLSLLVLAFLASFVPVVRADDQIPQAAWRRPIGLPLENAGGRKPELTDNIDDGYWQGAPVGGFGAGTLSRDYAGNFVRWHIKAGVHKYENIPANQFAVFARQEGGEPVALVLSTRKPQENVLSAWNWTYPTGEGEYAALYPKSWYAYKTQKLPVTLTLEQYSPILPDNYKETSYPVAVYNWYAANPTDKPVTVSLLFSWTNMIGWFRDASHTFASAINAQNTDHYKSEAIPGGTMHGIVFDRVRTGPVSQEWDGQFAIATRADEGAQVSYISMFDPNGTGAEVWAPFSTSGTLPDLEPGIVSAGEPQAGAIAVRFTLQPGEKRLVPMALSWDLPYIQFGAGRIWLRHYTKFFGRAGTNAWQIARTALENQQQWSMEIEDWQHGYVSDDSLPLWLRGELFNELYVIADGGTVWAREAGPPGNPDHPSAREQDTFSFLECFDYPFYSTLDVRFYGSFPLIKFWPEIEKQVMRQFSDTLPETNTAKYVWGWMSEREGKVVLTQRKTAGSAPHDLGNPIEDPFVVPNHYNWQSVTNWKDLNSKFVLLVWRDYVLTGRKDTAFVRYSYDAVKMAMEYLRKFDANGDGLIENDGYPDQTYDEWLAKGQSAYSGGLYLAALRAEAEMAELMGDIATAEEAEALLKKASETYVGELWNGKYFNYDAGSQYKNNIMAEQLAGNWYAEITGLGPVVPDRMARAALQQVFDYNVMKFYNGQMGALNGIGADGTVLEDNEQIQEVWSGATFSIASHMLLKGMREQAFQTARGVYNVVWQDKGYWFRTPEAWDKRGLYRASMYMRPGAIWSIQIANELTRH